MQKGKLLVSFEVGSLELDEISQSAGGALAYVEIDLIMIRYLSDVFLRTRPQGRR